MTFQASVGVWIAVHVLARQPLGGSVGINNMAVPLSLHCETGTGLDDIEVSQSDGGTLQYQSKTSATLSTVEKSPLGKTLAQLVEWALGSRAAGETLDPVRDAAVLVVEPDPPRTLGLLDSALRAVGTGDWATGLASRSGLERAALASFVALVTPGWTSGSGAAPEDTDLAEVGRLFHIRSLDMSVGGTHWREATHLLERHVTGDIARAGAMLHALDGVLDDLIGAGGTADRDGLIRELRRLGCPDFLSPGFDADIAKVRAASEGELARLVRHAVLTPANGIPVERDIESPLVDAINGGSLVLTGEPGAGKTGALVSAVLALCGSGHDVVVLSVDQYPGIGTAHDLQTELRLSHPVAEVLAAFPGAGTKILVIDALDAARGGPSGTVFTRLMNEVRMQAGGDWHVVVSVRHGDLARGFTLKESFAGIPPDVAYSDPKLSTVRHFVVPRLTDSELARVGQAQPGLGALLASAPPGVGDLLRNIFNLSLASQLVDSGLSDGTLAAVATQSDLIDAYESARLPTTALERAVRATAEAMVGAGRMSVRKVKVNTPDLDAAIASGVLESAGDRVGFSHHVLFDHAIGRFFLNWEDPGALVEQLTGKAAALVLAPGLRFAIERMWRDDNGPAMVWEAARQTLSSDAAGAVLGTTVVRVAVECVRSADDVAPLIELAGSATGDDRLLARVANIVFSDATTRGSVVRGDALADLAAALACTGRRMPMHSAMLILRALQRTHSTGAGAPSTSFGTAARLLLEKAWSPGAKFDAVVSDAVGFVGESISTDVTGSLALLSRVLGDRWDEYAFVEAPALADAIVPIVRAAPEFAEEIYRTLFEREVTDKRDSWLGGPSRIMPLLSNRQQDYEHSWWTLGHVMESVLEADAWWGTRCVAAALLGQSRRSGHANVVPPETMVVAGKTFCLFEDDTVVGRFTDDGEEDPTPAEDTPLAGFHTYLARCSVDDFARCVDAAMAGEGTMDLWAALFSAAQERPADLGATLWPLVENGPALLLAATQYGASAFIASMWPKLDVAARERFEHMIQEETLKQAGAASSDWRQTLGRLFGGLGPDSFVLEATRSLRTSIETAGLLRSPADDAARPRRVLGDLEGFRDKQGARPEGAGAALWDAVLDLQSLLGKGVEEQGVGPIWAKVLALRLLLAGEASEGRQVRDAWGWMGVAVVAVAGTLQGGEGAPPVGEVLAIIDELSASRYPEASPDDGHLMTSSWDIRPYAAKALLALVPIHGATRPSIVDGLERLAGDPIPSVRNVLAQGLGVLAPVCAERMWDMLEGMVLVENSEAVLKAMLAGSLRAVARTDPGRTDHLLELAALRVNELPRPSVSHQSPAGTVLGQWAARRLVSGDSRLTDKWLGHWTADPVRYHSEIVAFLASMRAVFVARYAPGVYDVHRQGSRRAQAALEMLLPAALAAAATLRGKIGPDDDDKSEVVGHYRNATSIVMQAMNQLFFGAGASNLPNNASSGLADADAKRAFLDDYATVLDLLASASEPSILHRLVTLYAFLVPADPARVFDQVHALVTGKGAEAGYQFERQAADAIVAIVARYIADHRSLFDDNKRQAKLVEMLALFADVGWGSAMQLLYDLPELLR